MSTEKMQEDFEEFSKREGLDLSYHHKPGCPTVYFYADTNWAWRAWQASRAAVVIELPIPKELCGPDGMYLEYFEPDQIERAIEAASLKVKP